MLKGAEDAGQGLGERRYGIADLVGDGNRRASPNALGQPARDDRRCPELLAGGLVPGPAALAAAAGQMMDERDPAPVLALGNDLMPEHGSCRVAADLLNVGPAQASRTDAEELTVTVGLRELGDHGFPGGV
jgi:hypothetical protein